MSLIALWVMQIISWVGALAGLGAFIHALLQRSDAFTAADRKTKPIWLLITGVSTVVMGLFPYNGGAGGLLWLAGLVAALVYLVDVRPKLIEVQRGGNNW
ncbi:DUF2516 family protein [Amycolatopsis rhizosphaerae]|uniref:DUF2516 family protein n=1 Tax=Amycolatopsis rhizosphaerae TaxID=2053003 RepID=A0A558DDK3_9PSEU|nr:DUF2516 family protein [Amycolatopsis rhizosphaerae]TVT59087.1 DUF2516 family protein [Amycolatopsis rhizosphaerae]